MTVQRRSRSATPGRPCAERAERRHRRGASRAHPLRDAGDGWFEAELGPLPEGVYRITSLGGSVEPVTDLITVVDG